MQLIKVEIVVECGEHWHAKTIEHLEEDELLDRLDVEAEPDGLELEQNLLFEGRRIHFLSVSVSLWVQAPLFMLPFQ